MTKVFNIIQPRLVITADNSVGRHDRLFGFKGTYHQMRKATLSEVKKEIKRHIVNACERSIHIHVFTTGE